MLGAALRQPSLRPLRLPRAIQLRGQLADALAAPAQRRWRVSSGQRFDQSLQILLPSRIEFDRLLAAPRGTTDPRRGQQRGRLFQFRHPCADHLPRHPARSGNRRNPAPPNARTLRRYEQAPRSFVEHLRNSCEPRPNCCEVCHPPQYKKTFQMEMLFPDDL